MASGPSGDASAARPGRAWPVLLCLSLTALSAWALFARVRLSPDVAALLPDRGEAASLARYARAFGGGDPGLLLVEGGSIEDVTAAAEDAAGSIAGPHIVEARDRLDLPLAESSPSQWMLLARGREREAVRRALSPEGMRARLAETRALLLAPGGAAAAPMLAGDPLRIGQLVASGRAPAQSTPVRPDGAIVSDDGRARIVVIEPSGNALTSADARGFVADVERSLAPVRARHPGVSMRLTGGHAIGAATEAMLRRDLTLSSALSTALASLVFVGLFRRARALLAILPPLACGTVAAAAVAAVFPHGLSAIAVAFASVVVGVGMDTGVHVYAAVREAAAAGEADPARAGVARTARPVLGAALVAGAAFGCLSLSRVEALRQFGLLAAVGEVATALAILALTPPLCVLLERRASPPQGPPRWTEPLARLSSSPRAGALALGACALAIASAALTGPPRSSSGLLIVRPEGLEPHAVYEAINQRFGTASKAPWVVLIEDADRASARARADRLFDALSSRPDVAPSVDGLSPWAPSAASIAEAEAFRRSLSLPERAVDLEAELGRAGFSPGKFRAALDDLRRPAPAPDDVATRKQLGARYEAELDGRTLEAIYVQSGDEAALEQIARAADPEAAVTGYPRLEPSLSRALAHDLPRVGAAALALATLALALTLRRAGRVLLALFVVATEIALVFLAMRAASVPLHVFDALVLPVLLGITLDEVLFVMSSASEADRVSALRHEAPLVATTACTTAAGFAALLVCRFDPLRHLGLVGAAGSLAGLLLALVVVPAWAGRER